MQVNLNLTQPQKTKNNPNFGINFKVNSEFSERVASEGAVRTQQVLDVFKRMSGKFPEDTRTFKVHNDLISIDEKDCLVGSASYSIKNLDNLEKTIKRAVADYKAMLSLPKYTEQLSKKYGLNISCYLKNAFEGYREQNQIGSPRGFVKAFNDFSEVFSQVPNKEKYQIKFWNRDDQGYGVFPLVRVIKDGEQIGWDESIGSGKKASAYSRIFEDIPELKAKMEAESAQGELDMRQQELQTKANLSAFSSVLKTLNIPEFTIRHYGM